MPEMDGFELAEICAARRARASRSSSSRRVPLASWVFRGYESGGVDFLYKPLDERILRSKVDVFLQLDRQAHLLEQRVQELQQAERQLRDADRRKDEFLGVLSHELRNPLAPIRNAIFVLGRVDPASDQATRARSVIERQVTHLARIVDDLLDVTRVSSGKVQLRTEPIELGDAVRRSAEDYRTSFVRAGLDLVVTTPTVPIWTTADPTRIAQAVGNLLANALKFTPSGGRVRGRARPGPSWRRSRSRIPAWASQRSRPHLRAVHAGRPHARRSRGGLGLGSLVKVLVEGCTAARSRRSEARHRPRRDVHAPSPRDHRTGHRDRRRHARGRAGPAARALGRGQRGRGGEPPRRDHAPRPRGARGPLGAGRHRDRARDPSRRRPLRHRPAGRGRLSGRADASARCSRTWCWSR
jgi:hypothetical protein